MAKRSYTKKSEYWSKFDGMPITPTTNIENVPPALVGRGIMDDGKSVASRTGAPTRSGDTSHRRNRAAAVNMPAKYNCIAECMLPYSYTADGVDVRTAIELCQKAYAGVPIVRNSVDLMAEFANSDIYLEGGNEASRKFFEAWFAAARVDRIKAQYFLEYYRGSNIFFYKQYGKLTADAVKKLAQFMSSKSRLGVDVPIKYILLNAVDVMADLSSSFSATNKRFFKVLTEYELARLKNPNNDTDKAILASFTPEEQAKIKKGDFQRDGIKIEIDPTRLIYSFAKKQDYEPFAIPFLFPVLADVNMKLELKKLDQAIMRTVENVVLLVTMGAKPEDGGINPENIRAMQDLLRNESVGRALVADYTTKAEFIIPDIAKVVGKEKYEVVNEDIKEGLQNIITGDDKYASTAIKAQMFLERLNESRTSFLNDFLIPEMYAVANALGFKNLPTPRFRETTLKDEVQFNRAITRLIELSVLTPEQGIEAMKNGRLPNTDEFVALQKEFKKQKDDGLYVPIIGGTNPEIEAERLDLEKKSLDNDIKVGQQQAKTAAVAAKNKPKPKQQSGRPTGSKANFSVAAIKEAVYKTDELFNAADKIAQDNKFSTEKSGLIQNLCKSIIESVAADKWIGTLIHCCKNHSDIPVFTPLEGVLDVAAEHDLDTYEAALIYHGQCLTETK